MIAAIAVGLLLAGCGSSNSNDKPAPRTTVATTPAKPTLSKVEVAKQCAAAIAKRPADDAGEIPSEPTPEPCKPLSDSEYLDAYMDGIHQANEAAQDEFQQKIDGAAEDATP
ncbi:hypothetical protein [Streptomyces sparsogenes]|uniref:hypothetical protein n=1 Tax=Streptomyces sparsogenes TaxID=67365 RepID=UPI0033EB6B14